MTTAKLTFTIFAFAAVAFVASTLLPRTGAVHGAESPLANLQMRNIGPGYSSGRVVDFAFHPTRRSVFYVAMASAGIWKTETYGARWTPVFENEGSFATGVVELNPANPLEVWVGTGENNNQRSVGFGDGVYKSIDGGKTWRNMGLKESGHIGHIRFDPRDSNVVYVTAIGPLWSDGGDRGFYKTTDGGETWNRIHYVDEFTGANEALIHAERPDEIILSTFERYRRRWTLIDGGRGSGLWKSYDAGETWTKLTRGLPNKELDLGRIGIAQSASHPNIVYAIIEGQDDARGVFRSIDFGENWEKRSDHGTNDAAYYNEIFVDPKNPDRIYQTDTHTWVSEDGGKTWQWVGSENRHSDDHAVWIDPEDTDHLFIGGDGGVYESWDRGANWRRYRNLPATQFYRVQPDNAVPFYNVYGGTQDSQTLGGPSRTNLIHGITNFDWEMQLGGDGYEPQIDPNDPNIIYVQSQYGYLTRYDKRTTERISIRPMPAPGENQFRWYWATPLIISPHDPKRLYTAAEKVFRSDDRGDNWNPISPDLSKGIDRDQLPVGGRVWSIDALRKNKHTSPYGSVVALAESPLVEGLLYAGLDDGMIQVSENGGESWRASPKINGVPELAMVEEITPSLHDPDTAFAVFDHHKSGDFRPYVMKTTDRGRSWKSISGDLPDHGTAHTIDQDHVDPDLLFVGTHFGLFFSQNGGARWVAMRGNFPTISVRDIEVQRRETDLVVGTFGRGIYILDDYAALRTPDTTLAEKEAVLFPIRDTWRYHEGDRWGPYFGGSYGDEGKDVQGADFYTAPNPPYGAIITYYLRDGLKTQQELRREEERPIDEARGNVSQPGWDALRAEDREEDPELIFTIRNESGDVVRRITGPTEEGLHRIAWDLRAPSFMPVRLKSPGPIYPWQTDPKGPLAPPGVYTITLDKRVSGTLTRLADPQAFRLKPANISPDRQASNPQEVFSFQQQASELYRTSSGASRATGALNDRIAHLSAALKDAPDVDEAHHETLRAIENQFYDVKLDIFGDPTKSSRATQTPLTIGQRIGAAKGHWGSLSEPTGTQRESAVIAKEQLERALVGLRSIDEELSAFEKTLDEAGVPWTPGRIPSLRTPE